jgi:hypothetical protein
VPSLADLASGAGDLLAVEVDVEVVPVKAFAFPVLAGGVARQWPADGDLVLASGLFQADQGGVAAFDQVFARRQGAARQAAVDAGQGLPPSHAP